MLWKPESEERGRLMVTTMDCVLCCEWKPELKAMALTIIQSFWQKGESGMTRASLSVCGTELELKEALVISVRRKLEKHP